MIKQTATGLDQLVQVHQLSPAQLNHVKGGTTTNDPIIDDTDGGRTKDVIIDDIDGV